MIGEDPATVEEYIPGSLTKYINNNGQINFNSTHERKDLLDR